MTGHEDIVASDKWLLGLMSGTSMDGIDGALIRSDGQNVLERGPAATFPYPAPFRDRLRAVMGSWDPVDDVERDLTLAHVSAVRGLLDKAGLASAEVSFIGFHGQTVDHAPAQGRTRQIGDAKLLARQTGIAVVSDFRSRDVAEGGEGAPLAPLYHAALARDLERPLAVLNLGGVANITWIGVGEEEILAFDCGPGNALIDDWVLRKTGAPFDRDGALAAAGRIAQAPLEQLLSDPYFVRQPPKSLDRGDFDIGPLENLSAADGSATLTAFTVAAVALGRQHMPAPPKRWLVTGGGRLNALLMSWLSDRLETAVQPVEAVGWDGDALEAEAFAFLAARVVRGLPTSLPSTTGVSRPVGGGKISDP